MNCICICERDIWKGERDEEALERCKLLSAEVQGKKVVVLMGYEWKD